MDEALSPRGLDPRRPTIQGTDAGPLVERDGDDKRAGLQMQVLSTEHFSLLSQRSLVYNEAFTRVGMFLTFLSMSFVALALLSGAMQVDQTFLLIATVVLAFDLVIGIATLIRVRAANGEDLLAVQAMTRIRHGYLELAPETEPYFSTGTHDDIRGTLLAYGPPNPSSVRANLIYGLSTSGGMLVLVLALLAGTFGVVSTMLIGGTLLAPFAVGAVTGLLTLVIGTWWAYRGFRRNQRNLVVRFPRAEADATSR